MGKMLRRMAGLRAGFALLKWGENFYMATLIYIDNDDT
jgi:hypothetical protein